MTSTHVVIVQRRSKLVMCVERVIIFVQKDRNVIIGTKV